MEHFDKSPQELIEGLEKAQAEKEELELRLSKLEEEYERF